MNVQRKKALWQVGFGVALLFIAGFLYWSSPAKPTVSNFAECAEAGNPVMESYPRQCKGPDGQTFREDIGNELEKDDLIRLSTPRPNASISSPLLIKGVARGNWFFEASFPVRLLDADGTVLGQTPAQAKGDWMTTDFVPFVATLTFTEPSTKTGTLILEKDNPSGLPEHADELRIPVTFEKVAADDAIPTAKACVASGCSGQICADEEMMSTCEFKEGYACYKSARCERQASGKCGWTETNELLSCLNQTRNDIKSPQ